MPTAAGNDEGGCFLKEILRRAADIFYPRRCVVCDRVLPADTAHLCRSCEGKLRYVGEQYCLKCGKNVTEGEAYCAACGSRGKTAYESGRVLFWYDVSMRESISRFKYHGRREYASFYAEEMERICHTWIEQAAPQVLIPVPIHEKRLRKRGYNQAEILARELGKRLELPVWSDFLVRTKNTLPQKGLSRMERMENVSQAFSVDRTSQKLYNVPNCVIIIDDIYTTGSTIEACACVLKREGVKRIFFLCISAGQQF